MVRRLETRNMISYTWIKYGLFLFLYSPNASRVIILDESSMLDHYLCGPGNAALNSNTELLLSPEVNHYLRREQFCLVNGLSNISIKSLEHGVLANITSKKIKVFPDVAVGFHNVSNLTIEDINITHIGGCIPKNDKLSHDIYPNDGVFYFPEQQPVVLLISHTNNVALLNLHTRHCFGLSIFLENLHGHVLLKEISVQHSANLKNATTGLLLMSSNKLNQDCLINIIDCNLRSNFGIIQLHKPDLSDLFNTQVGVPINIFSACFTVLFSDGNYTSNVNITGLTMKYCYGGYFGGFAAIYHNSPISRTQITIRKLFLSHNYRFFHSITGIGVFTHCDAIGSMLKSHSSEWKTFCLDDAEIRDGIFFPLTTPIDPTLDSAAVIRVITHQCTNISVSFRSITYFQKYYGYRNPFLTVNNIHETRFLLITIEDIKMFVLSDDDPYISAVDYGKMVFMNVARVLIEGDSNVFVNQTGSVIQAFNTDIYFKGSAKFIQNRAYQGAAISLHSSSHLYIYETTNITFEKNRAFLYGGALYSDVDGSAKYTKPLCAIQVVFVNISFLKSVLKFKDNLAGRAGMSVYMNPLYNCKQVKIPTINLHLLYSLIFKFENSYSNIHTNREVSSIPVTVYFCDQSLQSGNQFRSAFPGQTLSFRIQGRDGYNSTPYSTIQATFTEVNLIGGGRLIDANIPLQIKKNQEFQHVFSNNCSTLFYTFIPKKLDFHNLKLKLSIQGHEPTQTIRLIIKKCPTGFHYYNNKTCNCSAFLTQRSITVCNIDNTSATISPGSWLSVMDKQMLGFSYHCPSGYCKTTLDINISRSHDICTGSRQGTLCGQCQKGYSVVLGSVECRKCTDSSSFIIPVYIGAAVIYVSVLFTLRLTVDVGTIGGLVFWVDGMTIANDMLFNMFGNQGHIAYLYTVLNAFHCQWQLTTCAYSGMGSAVKQSLSFASSVFLWVIVALIIWTSRCSTKLANLLVGSGVQVLATVMYVSFSNLFISCLQVLTPAYVYTSNDSTPLVVWYTDGTLLYGKDPAHIGLMCVSIMTLLFFVIPYVLIGLFGKKVLRFYYIVKYLRPYIEALHGPYKHGKGYWFGLRLIVLCAMFIIHCSFGGRKLEVEIFLIFIVLGVYILALALIVPFNSKALNALELVLSALLLLYFTTISLFYAEENWSKATRLSVLGTTTLIGLLILVYHIALSCKKLSRRNCYKLKFPNVQLNKKMRNFIDPEPTHARLIEPDCDNENEDLRRNELQYETW